MFRVKAILQTVGLNINMLERNFYAAILRAIGLKKEECCKLIALHTLPNTCEDFHDEHALNERAVFFRKQLASGAIATLLIYVLSMDKTNDVIKYLGIDKEQKKMEKVASVKSKNNNNSIEIGGKSVFGAFIARLHELGYNDTEILYERPHAYLQLVLADKLTSIYMSDEEMESVPKWAGGSLLLGDNPDDANAIEEYIIKNGITLNT